MSELKGRNLQEYLDRQVREQKAIRSELQQDLEATGNMIENFNKAIWEVSDPHTIIHTSFKTLSAWKEYSRTYKLRNEGDDISGKVYKNRSMAEEEFNKKPRIWRRFYHIVRI